MHTMSGKYQEWINHLPLYINPIFAKSILNTLVCKFDRMENTIFLIMYW